MIFGLFVICYGMAVAIQNGLSGDSIIVILTFVIVIGYAFWSFSLFPDIAILEDGIRYRSFVFTSFIAWEDVNKISKAASHSFLRGHSVVLLKSHTKVNSKQILSMTLKSLISQTERPILFISSSKECFEFIQEANKKIKNSEQTFGRQPKSAK